MDDARARWLGLCPLLGAGLGLSWIFFGGGFGHLSAAPLRNPVVILLLLELLHLTFITRQWFRYRVTPAPPDDQLPPLTVIIPAYNEGPMVERSIRSAAAADYPRDKLEILVVDDGSRDDTFFHMENLRREFPALVKLVRFRGNQGKRAALRAGFEAARGEVVITIDSDSEIERGTLKAMAAPFGNPRVGGVAGWVRVLNRNHWMGRMLDVQFTMSFDLLRAAQSTFGAVFVCPGALSSFRRSVILPALDEWVNQRFLGRAVNHGEDQALTNIVLRAGYDTVYQRSAIVWTLVPTRYKQLFRMMTRWDRSYVVEGWSFARFMFSRYRSGNRLLPILGFLASTFRVIYWCIGLVGLPGLLLRDPLMFARGLLAGGGMALCSSLYYLRTGLSLRFLWGVFYAFYSFVALQWTLPYAFFTVREEKWGTR